MVLLYLLNSLSAAGALLGIGCVHAIVLTVWLVQHQKSFRIRKEMMLADFFMGWNLGRWLLASQIAMIAAGHSLPWIIAWKLGESNTGVYFGCATLVNIGAPLLVAAQNVLSPRSATAFAESGLDGLRQVVRRATVGMVLCMGIFAILLAVGGHYLVEVFFGAAYAGQGAVVTLLAMNGLAYASMLGAASGLTVLERTELLFRAHLVGILVTVTMAFALIGPFGLSGAAVAQLAGTVSGSIIAITCYRRVVGILVDAKLALSNHN